MKKREKARCVSAKLTTGLALTLIVALLLGGSALGENGLEEAIPLAKRALLLCAFYPGGGTVAPGYLAIPNPKQVQMTPVK